jgi:hypothetical protein
MHLAATAVLLVSLGSGGGPRSERRHNPQFLSRLTSGPPLASFLHQNKDLRACGNVLSLTSELGSVLKGSDDTILHLKESGLWTFP